MKTIEIMDEIEQVLGDDYALDTNNEKVYVANGNVYEYWSDYHHEEGIIAYLSTQLKYPIPSYPQSAL